MFLLFDIGGTKTRVAVSKNFEKINENKVNIFPTPITFEAGISLITKTAKDLASGEKISFVAGGIGGALNSERSELANYSGKPSLMDWKNKPLKNDLEKELGCSVILENDSALGGLGEALYGSGKNYKLIAFITLGTGVGGAKIENGKIDENSMGFEPGKQIIDTDGSIFPNMEPPVTLGKILGGQEIKKRVGKIPSDIRDQVFWKKMTRYLAIGLNNTVVHWSPDVIILGGSVSREIEIDVLEKELSAVLTAFASPPKIKRATLGDLSGLYGALAKTKEALS